MMKDVVVTLFEKHYHYGVASLINSLIRHDFDGYIIVGYKGKLPFWVNQFKEVEEGVFSINGTAVYFIHVNDSMHLGYYKPTMIKIAFNTFPEISGVFYFDPDIVINTNWKFFSDWKELGVCLCLDCCFPFVHRNHPWRKQWLSLAGVYTLPENDHYVNSGFVGVSRKNVLLIDKWIQMTTTYKEAGGNLNLFEKQADRAFKGDQDLLNATITVVPEIPLSIIGMEGMGFSEPSYLLSHAIGSVKPWKVNFFKNLVLFGKPIDMAEKNYLYYANHPIKVFSKGRLFIKRINAKLASILGRLLN